MGVLRSRGLASRAIFLVIGLFALAGCTSQSAPTGQCLFDADCQSPLVCAAHYCRQPCRVDTDCPANNRCRPGSEPGQRVCVPTGAPSPCQYASDCDANQVCTRDGLCQSQCVHDYDCQVINPHQSCQGGVCLLQCADGTADCDTVAANGCEVVIVSDTHNCGACGMHCDDRPHTLKACASGRCQYTCLPGFGDCDGDATNGCEADLTQPSHCGACTRSCTGSTGLCSVHTDPATGTSTYTCADSCDSSTTRCGMTCADTRNDPMNCGACGTVCTAGPDSTAACNDGHCGVRCNDPVHQADCDGNPANGCEAQIPTDPLNCGACGVVCVAGPHGAAACALGHCGLTCETGYGNCDDDLTNGCEADLRSTVGACGSCGHGCSPAMNATGTCTTGACGIACATGYGDCDGDVTNGCEADLRVTVTACGACGHACPTPAHAVATCAASACGFTCAAGYADCDGDPTNGCEAALGTDPGNCGRCGMACAAIHGTPTCAAGACGIVCAAGFGDCDGLASNGCEIDLTSNTLDCGMCRHACAFPSAGARCAMGVCMRSECAPGRGDCDGIASNGCETDITTSVGSCGACGNACAPPHATPVCTAGHCGVAACAAGWADCNHDPADGCEVDTTTDPGHCGSCAGACGTAHGTATCAMSRCGITCAAGWGDCDMNPADGCETDLTSTVASCGACGSVCAPPHATPACTAGHCGIGACAAGFADCDHSPGNGCEVDVTSTVTSCGACGHACSFAHGAAACARGVCALTGCDLGFGDCDGNPTNGCETDLGNSTASCGACGRLCAPPHATPLCSAGACRVGTCATGFGDCDGLASNGCETDLTTTNASCGACGHACAPGTVCSMGVCNSVCAAGTTYCTGACVNTLTDAFNCGACGHGCPAVANADPTCARGTCGYACRPGFGDCDGLASNGCEAAFATSVPNCGGCGMACSGANGTPSCAGGACSIACNPGFGNCDGDARSNGCEAPTTALPNCGACGVTCAAPHVRIPVCQRGAFCGIEACDPGYADCDGVASNGCETDINNSNASCGSCGTVCAMPVGAPGVPVQCSTGVCRPANDQCAGATTLNLASGPHLDIFTSTVNATHDYPATCGSSAALDVYFTFTLTRREMVYADTFGMSYDTVLSFASGCTAPVAAGTAPGDDPCNDDATSLGCTSPDLQSQVVAVLNPGTYYLILASYGTATGTGTLHVEHFPMGNGPITQITFPATSTYYTTTGTTSGTGLIRGTCGGSGPENSYWLRTCPENAGGRFAANTCPTPPTMPVFDTVLYLNNGNTTLDACNDDTAACTGTTTLSSAISTSLAAGAGLHVVTVDSYFSPGNYALTVQYPVVVIGDRGPRRRIPDGPFCINRLRASR